MKSILLVLIVAFLNCTYVTKVEEIAAPSVHIQRPDSSYVTIRLNNFDDIYLSVDSANNFYQKAVFYCDTTFSIKNGDSIGLHCDYKTFETVSGHVDMTRHTLSIYALISKDTVLSYFHR